MHDDSRISLHVCRSTLIISMKINVKQTNIFDPAPLLGRYIINKLLQRFPDIVGTVYHLVIYMQSNKIHKVFQ